MARASKASRAAKKSGSAKSKTGGTAEKSAAKKNSKAKKAAAKKGSTAEEAAPQKSNAQKAAKRSTRKAKGPFDSRFLEQMRKLLVSERETYERQAAQLRAEAESLVADLDPGDVQFDEESGEGDTIAVERNRDLALAAKALEMIQEIDHALTKLEDGTYGLCEISGEPIPKERLEAIPWAREKVEYKVGGFGRR